MIIKTTNKIDPVDINVSFLYCLEKKKLKVLAITITLKRMEILIKIDFMNKCFVK